MTEVRDMAQIAEIVRQTRKAQGITQTILAQAANVGLRFVGDIERGKPTIQFDKLMAVLSALGVTVRLELP